MPRSVRGGASSVAESGTASRSLPALVPPPSPAPNPQCIANGREAKECKSVKTRRSVTVTICFSEGLIIGFTLTRCLLS